MTAFENLPPIYSIHEFSKKLKTHIEGSFNYVRLRGEISDFKRASSGHLYFRLRDDEAVINGICWRSAASKLSLGIADGIEVIALGRITAYEKSSQYQIIVDSLEPAGEGALLKMLHDRRKTLAAEGLFAKPARPLPLMPKTIAVVTSETGAVIQDILHRVKARMPTHLLLAPVKVQGAGAAEQIAHAIRQFNRMPVLPDVLIVARGGGSLQDLWAFNEEIIVRAAAESMIPLISAIGHETDMTLLDEAADWRAPTPTAAAEMATPVRKDLLLRVFETYQQMVRNMAGKIEMLSGNVQRQGRIFTQKHSVFEMQMQLIDMAYLRIQGAGHKSLANARQKLMQCKKPDCRYLLAQKHAEFDRAVQNIEQHIRQTLHKAHSRWRVNAVLLESCSYHNILARGFALVKSSQSGLLKTAQSAKQDREVTIIFADGEANATVES